MDCRVRPFCPPRNDNVRTPPLHSLYGKNYHPCHREGLKARGDPLALNKRTALSSRVPRRHDGLPRRSLRSLLAMTILVDLV